MKQNRLFILFATLIAIFTGLVLLETFSLELSTNFKVNQKMVKMDQTRAKEDQNSSFIQPKDIFAKRRMDIQNYCNHLTNKPKTIDNLTRLPYPSQFVVLKERQLVWCPVYKSGSSSWCTYLVRLSNKPKEIKQRALKKYVDKDNSIFAPKMSLASWNLWLNQIHSENLQEIKFIGQVSH